MQYAEIIRIFNRELSGIYPEQEVRAIFRSLAESYEQLSLVSIHLFANQEIQEDSCRRYLQALEQLKANIPLQYILGEAWFMDLKLLVNPAVLIPRPETEEMVNMLIEAGPKAGSRILDLCTGSGCIALAAAYYLPDCRIWALDSSEKALQVAKLNGSRLKLNATFFQADVLEKFSEDLPRFDWMISNPPYIPASEETGMAAHVVQQEPHEALFVPDSDPLLFYRALKSRALEHLAAGGTLLMECHPKYAEEVSLLFSEKSFTSFEVIEDLSGKKRFVKAIKAT